MKAFTCGMSTVLCVVVAVFGCTGRTSIDLRYNPAGINIPSCSKTASVVMLKDERPKAAIGEKEDGKPFYSNDVVSEWVSRALYEELKTNGCGVEYHDKEYAFDTDYVIGGLLQEVFVKQESLSSYSSTLRMRIEIKQSDEVVFGKNYVSTLKKTTVPSPGINSKILTELLQGMMREVVPEIRKQIE
jgi:hypothetical protein